MQIIYKLDKFPQKDIDSKIFTLHRTAENLAFNYILD